MAGNQVAGLSDSSALWMRHHERDLEQHQRAVDEHGRAWKAWRASLAGGYGSREERQARNAWQQASDTLRDVERRRTACARALQSCLSRQERGGRRG